MWRVRSLAIGCCQVVVGCCQGQLALHQLTWPCNFVQGVLWGAYADADVAARDSAWAALQQLPLRLEYIEPLLQGLAASAQAPAPMPRKRGRAKKPSGGASTALSLPGKIFLGLA